MMRIPKTFLPALLLSLAAGGSFAQGDVETGAELYKDFGCYQCHQYSGAGYQGAPGGAPLVPMRFPLEGFLAYIRNPPLANRMPPYTEKLLTREQAEHIYAYIVALPQPRPKEEIELLGKIIEEIEAVE